MTSSESFAAFERVLDVNRASPRYLKVPEIAELVVASLRHIDVELHAWVVMPNHVHALLTPHRPIPDLMRSLKTYSAREANKILGTTGKPFWAEETFDRRVRDGDEFERIRWYIENNPVKAGLVRSAGEYRWSSAWEGGPPARSQPPAGEAEPEVPRGPEVRRP